LHRNSILIGLPNAPTLTLAATQDTAALAIAEHAASSKPQIVLRLNHPGAPNPGSFMRISNPAGESIAMQAGANGAVGIALTDREGQPTARLIPDPGGMAV
jgi:hypothetical protein